MQVTRKSPYTGKDNTLDLPVTQAQMEAWRKGMVIQRAMPHLTAEQREFLISGVFPGEFEMFLAFPVDQSLFTRGKGELVSESSTLGIPPGVWPDLVKFKDGSAVFERVRDDTGLDGEIAGAHYIQTGHFTGEPKALLIIND